MTYNLSESERDTMDDVTSAFSGVTVTTRFKSYFYMLPWSEWRGFRGTTFRTGQNRRWAIWHFRFGYYRKFPVIKESAI